MTLRQQMEEQWAADGCVSPLKPARWRTGGHFDDQLAPYYDSFVLDEDDGGPKDPPEAA